MRLLLVVEPLFEGRRARGWAPQAQVFLFQRPQASADLALVGAQGPGQRQGRVRDLVLPPDRVQVLCLRVLEGLGQRPVLVRREAFLTPHLAQGLVPRRPRDPGRG